MVDYLPDILRSPKLDFCPSLFHSTQGSESDSRSVYLGMSNLVLLKIILVLYLEVIQYFRQEMLTEFGLLWSM